MINIYLIGVLAIGAIAAAVLIRALLQAEEGYEDESGYHQVTSTPERSQASAWTRFDAFLITTPGEGI